MSLRIVIIALSVMCFAPGAFPKEKGPWKQDVLSGDECVRGAFAAKFGAGVPAANYRKVYNGFQGGAFFLIRFFQIFISPQDGPNCRFRPTCSAYGKQAVEKHGALLGAMLAGERILRCNPYSAPGNDPVPEKILTGR